MSRGAPADRRERDERVRRMVKDSIERLGDALDAGHSEQMAAFLKAMARFHRYSFQNIMLIVSQCPDATRVAGFSTWRSLGRSVRKGEKGIAIFAPMLLRAKASEDRSDEEPEKVLRFRVVHVFDIAQTEGEPLPEPGLVSGDPSAVIAGLEAAVAGRGITLRESEHLGGADGESRGGEIVLRSGLEPAERFSVLVHEFAHELLHQNGAGERPSKTVRETEAEAVAHVVCESVGLEVGTAASDYISTYTGDRELLMASLDRIQRTACVIIEAVQGEPDPSRVVQTAPHLAAAMERRQR